MTDESPKENQDQQIRQTLVNTAVNFLLNPGVINKPHEHKTAFLRKKGLNEAEIASAYEKAENNPKYKEIKRNGSLNNTVLPPPVPFYGRPETFWSQLSKFSSSLIVLGVAVFGAHYIYKKFIEPLIFGKDLESDKELKFEKQLLEVADSLSQLEKVVSALEENIKCQKLQMDKFLQNEFNEYYPTPLTLREIKAEMAAIKSILLNRHQFPAIPKVTPTIPHWQLPSKEDSNNTIKQNGEDKHQYESSTCVESSCVHSEDDSVSKQNSEDDSLEKLSEDQSVQNEYEEQSCNLIVS